MVAVALRGGLGGLAGLSCCERYPSCFAAFLFCGSVAGALLDGFHAESGSGYLVAQEISWVRFEKATETVDVSFAFDCECQRDIAFGYQQTVKFRELRREQGLREMHHGSTRPNAGEHTVTKRRLEHVGLDKRRSLEVFPCQVEPRHCEVDAKGVVPTPLEVVGVMSRPAPSIEYSPADTDAEGEAL